MKRTQGSIEVEGKTLEVSNLDKTFYPKTGFTKGEVINYYVKVAPVLLPHLKGRAITMKRYPDGVDGFFFYEKQRPKHAPKWLKTTQVKRSDGEIINYCMLNDLPSLVWAANIANLEIHPFTHRARAPKRPTALIFDLDPGPPAALKDCFQVALSMRAIFEELGMESFPKTSGSKGVQLVVPLNTPVTYEKTKAFAHVMARFLSDAQPGKVTDVMKKSVRTGKVFIDWSQNDDVKTTVCVYSLRAKELPSVSTPLQWTEVEKGAAKNRSAKMIFSPTDVLERVEKMGDLFGEVLTLKQRLPDPAKVPGLSDFV